MDAQRFVFKVYAVPPAEFRHQDLVAVLHEWIRERRIDEVLIDVADYDHVKDGPGVLLVCHHANYSLDRLDGRLGLTYNRKRDVEGTLPERLTSALRSTLVAAAALESHPKLAGKLSFSSREVLFLSNDRLNAPNTPETQAVLEPEIGAIARRLYGDAAFEITRASESPAERFGLRVRAKADAGRVGALVDRL